MSLAESVVCTFYIEPCDQVRFVLHLSHSQSLDPIRYCKCQQKKSMMLELEVNSALQYFYETLEGVAEASSDVESDFVYNIPCRHHRSVADSCRCEPLGSCDMDNVAAN